jgi:hypothetical protein
MNLIVLLFCTILFGVSSSDTVPEDCSKLEIKYTSQTSNGKITIDVIVRGGSAPYYYFFFDKKNNPLSWDFEKSYYTVDKEVFPKYIKVRDTEGCVKTIEFNESANN